jgi:hypothetical protein
MAVQPEKGWVFLLGPITTINLPVAPLRPKSDNHESTPWTSQSPVRLRSPRSKPRAHTKWGRPHAAPRCATLSGSHGEWTQSDDVSLPVLCGRTSSSSPFRHSMTEAFSYGSFSRGAGPANLIIRMCGHSFICHGPADCTRLALLDFIYYLIPLLPAHSIRVDGRVLDANTTSIHIGDDCEIDILLLLLGGNKKKAPKITSSMVKKVTTVLKARNARRPRTPHAVMPRNSLALSAVSRTYYNCLKHPLAISSRGCRVPDPYAFPTSTWWASVETTLSTPSAGTTVAATYFNNPVMSCLDTLSVATGSSCVAGFTNTYASNPAIRALATAAQLATLTSAVRASCWGIKLRNTQPPTTCTGRFIIALVPLGRTIPGYQALTNSTASTDLGTLLLNVPSGQLASGYVQQMPNSITINAQDLLRGEIEISFVPVGPDGWRFRTTRLSTAYNGTQVVGDTSLYNGSTGTDVQADNEDVNSVSGTYAIVVYGEGLPSNQGVLVVQYGGTLEGQPVTSTNTFVPSESTRSLCGSVQAVESAINAASGNNAYSFVDAARDFYNDVKPALFEGVRRGAAMAGMAMQRAMAGRYLTV